MWQKFNDRLKLERNKMEKFDSDAMCTCGHTLECHHKWWISDGQVFIDECEFYGFNETGGMMPNPDGSKKWMEHCLQFTPVKKEEGE